MDKSECDRLAEHTTTLDAVANALDSLGKLTSSSCLLIWKIRCKKRPTNKRKRIGETKSMLAFVLLTFLLFTSVCTYDRGYISQPVYACRVCSKGELKGFCYGCSMTCHLDHASEVIELFTKRDFRCDCPTLHHSMHS